eukprot:2439368-Amphidinium_carterae.1
MQQLIKGGSVRNRKKLRRGTQQKAAGTVVSSLPLSHKLANANPMHGSCLTDYVQKRRKQATMLLWSWHPTRCPCHSHHCLSEPYTYHNNNNHMVGKQAHGISQGRKYISRGD